MIAQARADGVPEAWLEAARKSPVWKMAMEWKVAFPLHPEYRTLPMVWYVPPLSPITAAAEAGKMGIDGGMPDVSSLRIPLKYLANLLTAGDEAPVATGLERMLAMRAYMRAKTVDGVIDEAIAAQGRPHRRSRSRRCTTSWRSPITRTASSSRQRTAKSPRTPTSCAASAASPSATAACRATTSVNLFGGIKLKNDKPKVGAY